MLARILEKFLQIGEVQRQSLIHFSTSILTMAAGFLSTICITHWLGTPDTPGGFFLFLSYLGIFQLVSSGGLGGAAVRLMSEKGSRDAYFSAFIVMRFILLIGSIAVIILMMPYLYDLTEVGLGTWLLAAVIISSLSDITGTYLYGTGMSGILQVSNLMNNLVRIGVQVIAVFLGYGIFGLAGSVIAGLVVGLLISFRYADFHLVHFNPEMIRNLVIFSTWAFFASGGMVVYTNADVILIGYYLTNADVGVYRIAIQLAYVGLFSALAISTIMYPKIVIWKREGNTALIADSLTHSISYSLLLTIPVCIGGTILGERMLYFMYGSAYSSGYPALVLLLVSQIISVFVYLFMMALTALDMPKKAAFSAGIATAINIGLNLVLIPPFGITGAACAMIATVAVHALSSGKILSSTIPIRIDRVTMKNILLAGAGMAGFLIAYLELFFPYDFISTGIGIVIGATIYLGLMIKLEKGCDTEIRKVIRQMGIVIPDWL